MESTGSIRPLGRRQQISTSRAGEFCVVAGPGLHYIWAAHGGNHEEIPHHARKGRAQRYTHQKEYALAVEEAKKPETRARRIEKAITELAAGKKTR